jgi:hypothetical protein
MANVDIEIEQGAMFAMSVAWTSGANPSVPNSLAGYGAHLQARLASDLNGHPLLDLSSKGAAPALTIEPGGQVGVVYVRFPGGAAGTAKLVGDCIYDLFVIKEDDPTEAVRLVHGLITVSRSVTVAP